MGIEWLLHTSIYRRGTLGPKFLCYEKIKRSTYRFEVVILHLWALNFRGKKGMRCCKKATVFIIYTPTPLTTTDPDHFKFFSKKILSVPGANRIYLRGSLPDLAALTWSLLHRLTGSESLGLLIR